jgi:hypothetical protein
MLRTQPKPKRGAEFTHNGTTVYLNLIKKDGLYLVSTDKEFGLDAEYYSVSPELLKKVFKIGKPISKGKPSKEKVNKQRMYNEFFQDQSGRIPRCCQCCNEPFGFIPGWRVKFVMAHLLPKSDFESVAVDPENLMFLCVFSDHNCHDQWDKRNAADRVKMACYPFALRQFEKFKHKLTEGELIKAYEYLGMDVRELLRATA